MVTTAAKVLVSPMPGGQPQAFSCFGPMVQSWRPQRRLHSDRPVAPRAVGAADGGEAVDVVVVGEDAKQVEARVPAFFGESKARLVELSAALFNTAPRRALSSARSASRQQP